ncbi:MAG: ferritin family protein [bacterium]|nr:ferritin family protein [bacterium]
MTPVEQEVLMALTSGIQSEIASYVFYLEAAKKSEAKNFKEVLEKLAYEEKDHYHILEGQYDSLVRSEKWISTSDILKQEGLPEINEEMSAEHQDIIDEVASAKSLADILVIAFRLEEEAYTLFAGAVDKVKSDEGKKIFQQLAKFEQGHMDLIADMQKKLV